MEEDPGQKRRFRVDLAYDGRPYSGWQSQPDDNGVQDWMQRAIRSICPEIGTVQGSGRTDAGVSAACQVAHFDAPSAWRMNGGEWQRALNTKLPPAIRVLRCGEISPAFHARFSALEKTYHYAIETGDVLPPLRHGLSWHQRELTADQELKEILMIYLGTHDFGAFSAKRHDGKDEGRNTVRSISLAKAVSESPESLTMQFRGNGFLYKMVRFLVGSAVYCRKGRISLEEMNRLLEGNTGVAKAPYCAPADGLTLVGVRYAEEFEIFQ